MSEQKHTEAPGITRIGMRAIMIIFVLAIILLATLTFLAELTVA